MITIDDINSPMIASTICKNASILRMQKLNNSSAKEPKMCNLDARHHKKQISSQLSKTNASISVSSEPDVVESNRDADS